jgi:tRNA modification GTPase
VGPPNAGKSSLLNYLARREAAIVSAVAGTTRDVIEVHLDLAGYPLVVADTAGLRAAADEVEEEGVRRALARANAADLRLVVVEAAGWPCIDASTAKLIGEDSILVLNKVDLLGGQPAARPESAMEVGPRRAEATVEISLTRGDGLGSLAAVLEQAVAKVRRRGSSRRRTCGWRRARLAASPAGWAWKTFWMWSSEISASGSEAGLGPRASGLSPVEIVSRETRCTGIIRAG